MMLRPEQVVSMRTRYVGGIIEERDKHAAGSVSPMLVKDVVLRPQSGSLWFAFVTATGRELGGDVRFLFIQLRPGGELSMGNRFGTSWRILPAAAQ